MNELQQLLTQFTNFTMNQDTTKIDHVSFHDLFTSTGEFKYQLNIVQRHEDENIEDNN